MSRKRGRPRRQYRIRVTAERRDQIDYSALARAVLEQAAIDEQKQRQQSKKSTPTTVKAPVQPADRHDRLA